MKFLFHNIKLLLKQFKNRIAFDDSMQNWDDASRQSIGYSSPEIYSKVKKAFLQTKTNPGTYQRDSVVFNDESINWPVICGILMARQNNTSSLVLMDVGGSFASLFYQNIKILKDFNIKWNIVEQEKIVNEGPKLVSNSDINFFDSIEKCLKSGFPDIVHFGSSLQYFEFPYKILEYIIETRPKFLIIDRIPVHKGEQDIIAIERVPKDIYNATYPLWIFSEDKLLKLLKTCWDQNLFFSALGQPGKTKTGVAYEWKGIILYST